jgi:hypothetical protein
MATTGVEPAPLEPLATNGPVSPWSFNLTPYAWLTGVTGNYTVGPKSKSVDVNFIDIAQNLSSIPVALMGRAEAHRHRLGFHLEGVYLDLTFTEKTGQRGSVGVRLSSHYGDMFRLAGPSVAEQIAQVDKSPPNRLDLYVGGRTFWLTNTLDPRRLGGVSADATLTTPVIGGRFGVDFGPDWFLMADGNVGGFGADQVSFTGSLQGMVDYRFNLAAVPTAARYHTARLAGGNRHQVEWAIFGDNGVVVKPAWMLSVNHRHTMRGDRPPVSSF